MQQDIKNEYNTLVEKLNNEYEINKNLNAQVKDLIDRLNKEYETNEILLKEKDLLKKTCEMYEKEIKDRDSRLEMCKKEEEAFIREAVYEYSNQKINLISMDKLLDVLIKNKKSLCRFGDGEFEIMLDNERPWFQDYSEDLKNDLKYVFSSDSPKILTAIPDIFGRLDKYTPEAAFYIRDYLKEGKRQKLEGLIDKTKSFYDAYVTRPYLMYRDKEYCVDIFQKFKRLWDNRPILVVEGQFVRMGYHNDLFDNAKKIERILCPEKNAYSYKREIEKLILKYAVETDCIVLIALGPAATVISFDIANENDIQIIDIGQLDNEYEWFLSKAENRETIKDKAVPEREDLHYANDINDSEYLNQIVERVGC